MKIPKKVRAELDKRNAKNRTEAHKAIALRGARLRLGHTHPGYIVGVHWLSVAYERICAGESEIAVMLDYGYRYDTNLRTARRAVQPGADA